MGGRTLGDDIEDHALGKMGVSTGSAINDLGLRSSEQPYPSSSPISPGPGGGGGGPSLGGELLSMGFFALLIGPGALMIGPLADKAIRWADHGLMNSRNIFSIAGAILGLLVAAMPFAAPAGAAVAGWFTWPALAGKGAVALAGAGVGGYLGNRFVDFLQSVIYTTFFVLSVLLTLASYIGVTFAGYMIYLKIFNGAPVAFLDGAFGLVASGWLALTG